MALARTLARRRLYYGWYIVGLAFLGIFVSTGLQTHIFSVFLKPMSGELGWSRTTFSLIISLCSVMAGFSTLIIGPLMDRYGGRWLMVFGGALTALGVMALGLVHSTWEFFLFRGLLITIGVTC